MTKWSSAHSPARSRSLSHRRHTPFPSVHHRIWLVTLVLGLPAGGPNLCYHVAGFRPPASARRIILAGAPRGDRTRAPEGMAHLSPTAPTTRVKWSSTHSEPRSRSLSHRRHSCILFSLNFFCPYFGPSFTVNNKIFVVRFRNTTRS